MYIVYNYSFAIMQQNKVTVLSELKEMIVVPVR
ncbi:hypothetical protein J2T02_002418 [Chitinophaga terrae (ex Kim and Jung 2007)]|nr:hypothetical protein [Chitinophaga terrae (ex Kim and Jung 2007)]